MKDFLFDFLTRGYSVICILLSPFIKIKKNRGAAA